MAADPDGLHFKVFKGGQPVPINVPLGGEPTVIDGGYVSHEVQHDAQYCGLDDPCQLIAKVLDRVREATLQLGHRARGLGSHVSDPGHLPHVVGEEYPSV